MKIKMPFSSCFALFFPVPLMWPKLGLYHSQVLRSSGQILNNENIYQDIFRVQEGGGIGWPTGDKESVAYTIYMLSLIHI